MTIVYQVIRDCSISYTKNGEDNRGFALFEGDYFFIEPDAYWIKKDIFESGYTRESVLTKIYYNKMNIDGGCEWTWANDINLIDPRINDNITAEDFGKVSPFYGQPFCKDVTVQWEREFKIDQLV